MKFVFAIMVAILISGCASGPTPAQQDYARYKLEIHGEIKNKRDLILGCYTHVKEKSPEARGKVHLEFIVNTEGKSEKINIRQDTHSPFGPFADYPKLSECMTQIISGITFSPPKFPGEIEYFFSQPFIFKPKYSN